MLLAFRSIKENNVKCSFKFGYAVKRNYDRFMSVMKSLEKPIIKVNNSKEASEYIKKRRELIKKHAAKELDGSVKSKENEETGQIEVDFIDKEKFEKEMKQLDEEFRALHDERDAAQQEYEKRLQDEADVEVYMVSENYVPELEIEILDTIAPMIRTVDNGNDN